ncbi:MAG TPA: tetratricopeptide repeat protein [Opitutaceae bacterium]
MTTSAVRSGPREGRGADWRIPALGAAIVAAVAAAYSDTFKGPMVFDDIPSIIQNPSIRSLWTALEPVGRSTVSGRPVVNATLSLNYAAGGLHVAGYHAANLAVHILAVLALFGILRRTLARIGWRNAPAAAFCASLLWGLHPLLTESVTYIVQRAESLMGLFYLLTLYCFIRGDEAGGSPRRAWLLLSVAACLLGMGSKEVMVSAPLIVLLYDRTFAAGSFRGALRSRPAYYAALGSTWAALLILVGTTHGRGGTAGFGRGIVWWQYGLTQLQAICHYLRLSIWPRPLVFDYGGDVAGPSLPLLFYGIVVAALLGLTAWAIVRRPALGFLGAWFFAILAPSSSVIPVVTETMAEHRMYLPLAAVAAAVMALATRWAGRAAIPAACVAAAVLGVSTWQRNLAYGSNEALWFDTAGKVPGNERALNNLGNELAKSTGRRGEAIALFNRAIRLQPGYGDAHYNLGLALEKMPGGEPRALAEFEEAVRLEPDSVEARNNYGHALAVAGRNAEAIDQLKEALRLDPGHYASHYGLGNVYSSMGRWRDAAAQYEEALRLFPDDAEARFNLGNTYRAMGRAPDALAQYDAALRLRPGYAEAHYNLANLLVAAGRPKEATVHFTEAIRLRPDFVDAHVNLGAELEREGKLDDAIRELKRASALQPGAEDIRLMLGSAQLKAGLANEAAGQFAAAVDAAPADPSAHMDLAAALLRVPGRSSDAAAQLREVLRLQPGNARAARLLAEIGGAP